MKIHIWGLFKREYTFSAIEVSISNFVTTNIIFFFFLVFHLFDFIGNPFLSYLFHHALYNMSLIFSIPSNMDRWIDIFYYV